MSAAAKFYMKQFYNEYDKELLQQTSGYSLEERISARQEQERRQMQKASFENRYQDTIVSIAPSSFMQKNDTVDRVSEIGSILEDAPPLSRYGLYFQKVFQGLFG